MSRFIDKLYDYYVHGKTGNLTAAEKKKKKIIDTIIEMKLADIAVSDRKILTTIQREEKISFYTLLGYITLAERIIASTKYKNTINPEKAWYRYFIVESAKEAFRIAREKNDAYSMIQAANIIGKHNNTDKEDEKQQLYDQIIPFVPEITTDPSVLGIKPIKNLEKVKEKLRNKYLNAIEIEYEEIRKEEDIPE